MSTWRRFISLVSVLAIMFMISAPALQAQDSQGGSGLIISPTRSELEILSGGTSIIRLSLKNVSGTDITAKAEVNDFESNNATGEPRILTGPPTSGVSIRPFLGGVNDIELAKDEKKDFEISVAVAENAAAGAYYGVLRYSAIPKNKTETNQDGSQVALTASVGLLILLTVPGDIQEQIQINSIKVLRDTSGGTFFFNSPNKVNIDIKNNGNGFSKPFGQVYVTNSRGASVFSYELNDTDPKSNILPKSSRTFTNAIENIKSPGRYTVTANISHGSGGEVLTYRTSFWFVPTWLAVAFLVLLLVVVLVVTTLYKKRFSSKRAKSSRRR